MKGWSPLLDCHSTCLTKLFMKNNSAVPQAKGGWVWNEMQQLDKNIKVFLQANQMEMLDLSTLLRDPSKEVKKLRAVANFWLLCCLGIARPQHTIRPKVIEVYGGFIRSEFTEGESRKITQLHERDGKGWRYIGTIRDVCWGWGRDEHNSNFIKSCLMLFK